MSTDSNSYRFLCKSDPPKEIMDRVSGLAKFCCEKHGLAAVEWLRLRKSGRRLYLDVSFATQQNHDIKTIDGIRHEIRADMREELPELDVLLEFTSKKTAVSGAQNSSPVDGAGVARITKDEDL
jgi:predicted Co/Zn/Cd cation transporter (cation efflux family)